jgi:hydroxymethylpyrimidine pyrophosphatase-like HAD family hydrolase
MADFAGTSCAPANAHPDVIKRFTETIRPNTEHGVTKKIIELLG